jgi:hypothetical protein
MVANLCEAGAPNATPKLCCGHYQPIGGLSRHFAFLGTISTAFACPISTGETANSIGLLPNPRNLAHFCRTLSIDAYSFRRGNNNPA